MTPAAAAILFCQLNSFGIESLEQSSDIFGLKLVDDEFVKLVEGNEAFPLAVLDCSSNEFLQFHLRSFSHRALRNGVQNDLGWPAKWRGVRRNTPNPSFKKYQPACKPGSGGHRLACARTIRDGHSSGAMFAHGLEQPTRTVEPDTALRRYRLAANGPRCRPYSVLLPVGFTMPVPLPDPRCALTAPFHPYRAEAPRGEGGRFVLCGTFPGVAPAGRYPAPYVDGARTFLSCGLSALAGAAVRPTDEAGMEAAARAVKRYRLRGSAK